MHRIFVPIYNYFKFHKPLMYIIMAVSFGVFLFFGLKVKYEEDISKLLPESSVESQLAFGSIGLKDKVFIQVTSADEPLDVVTLAERTDEFMEYLLEVDSSSHYIANILYQMEPEMALNALDFVLEHVPSFVDTSAYPAFEKAMEPETAAAQMQKDAGNELMASTISNMAAQNAARKDRATERMNQTDQAYANRQMAFDNQRAQEIASAAGAASNAIMSVGSAFDSQGTRNADLNGASNNGEVKSTPSDTGAKAPDSNNVGNNYIRGADGSLYDKDGNVVGGSV